MPFLLFTHVWWLIFPVMFFAMGMIRIILKNDYRRRKLDLIKSYIDNGKEVPDALKRELEQ